MRAPSKPIDVGDFVKIRRPPERFWIRVDARDADSITGTVSNDLVASEHHGLDRGSVVRIAYDEVLDHQPAKAN